MTPHPFTLQPLKSLLWKLALPGVVGTLVMAVHGLVDAMFIGKFLGEDSLAGLTLGMPLSVLSGALTGWIGGGAASLGSRALGRGDGHAWFGVRQQVLLLSLAFSAVLGAAAFFFVDDFLRFMGGHGKHLEEGIVFYRISLMGGFFSLYGVAMNGMLRAEGRPNRAMLLAMLSIAINIVLDALFLGVLHWGIAASAWSTILSTAVLGMAATRLTFPPDRAEIIKSTWVNVTVASELLAAGSPALISQATVLLRQTLLFQAMARWGDARDIAVLGAVFRLFSFAILPVFGLMQSLQPVAGIHDGAREYRRVLQALCLWSAAGILLLIPAWSALMAFPEFFLSLFISDPSGGSWFSGDTLISYRWALLGMPLLVFPVALLTCLQAVGQHRLANILSLGRQLALFPFLLFTLAFFWQVRGIYYALAAESLLFAAFAFAMFAIFRSRYPRIT